MKKLKTLTVVIPAHNEEANIGKLLLEILSQKQEGFRLEQIIVQCDACTDRTVQIARSIKSKKIVVKSDGKRKGKLYRLNQSFKISTSDILICFDADIILGNQSVLTNIARKFKNSKVGLVCANDSPSSASTLTQSIAVTAINMWYEMRNNFRHGSNAHNSHGCAFGLSYPFYKSLQLPLDFVADDVFVYYQAIRNGFRFSYAKDAIVYYTAPKTWKDYVNQSVRFLSYEGKTQEMFGDLINEHAHIPFKIKIRAVLVIFWKNPMLLILSMTAQIYIRLVLLVKTTEYEKGIWNIAISTKK